MPTAEQVVTTAWTPPPTITGFSGTALEESSAIQLNWDQSTLTTTDFVTYRIYRRIVGEELYTILKDITDLTVTEYRDDTAGQTVQYEYIVTQYKAVVGDIPLESNQGDVVSIALVTDAWFMILMGNFVSAALELNVIEEEHSAVVQQEVFEPLASNRKRVVRGNVLGDEGSITAFFDTSSITDTKAFMERLKNTKGPHLLKSPFGDVWFVEFDAPGFKYTTGGHMEISTGWVEVV